MAKTKKIFSYLTPEKQHFVYFGIVDGVIRWVGAGMLDRVQQAINNDHTCFIRYGVKFDQVQCDFIPRTKEEAKEIEDMFIGTMGRFLLNVQGNPYKGVEAREALQVPVTKEARINAGLRVSS